MGLETVPLDSSPSRMEEGQLAQMQKKLDGRLQDGELRILIFTACYFILDGVTLTIRRLESYLRSKGATVKVVTTVPEDVDPELLGNLIVVPSVKIPFTGLGYSFGSGLEPGCLSDIEEFQPNICHFTVPDLVGFDAIHWCLKNNVGYMATWHSNYADYLKYYFLEWLMKAVVNRHLQSFYERMPVVYVPTPYIRDKMQNDGYGQRATIREWGRGVDLKLFTPDRRSEAFRAARGIKADDVIILWMGRIVAEKGPDIYLNVCRRLMSEGIGVHAMIVGHGAMELQLQEEIEKVTCCGWLSGTSLAEAYASADILLFPSAVETFGNVTLEALASGCVCIVEDLCGGHLVDHGHNGFTCPAGDEELFYSATRRIALDHDLRKEMSVNARQSAWKFERTKILQMMAENYKDAIELTHSPDYGKRSQDMLAEIENDVIKKFSCCTTRTFARVVAEPIFITTASFSDLASNTNECTNRMRFSCSDLRGSLEDDWHDYRVDKSKSSKSKPLSSLWSACQGLGMHSVPLPAVSNNVVRATNMVALVISYIIFLSFFLACIQSG